MKEAKQSMMKFMNNFPDSTYKEFLAATGGSKQSWYDCRFTLRKAGKLEKFTKKSPDEKSPAKKKTVKVKSYKRAAPNETEYDHVSVYNKLIELQKENAELRHQIVGFRSVISYLENLAGLRNSQ
jgi:hypothetical protein